MQVKNAIIYKIKIYVVVPNFFFLIFFGVSPRVKYRSYTVAPWIS